MMLDMSRRKDDQDMPEAARHPDADYLEAACKLAGVSNIHQLAIKARVDASGLHKRMANSISDRLSQPTMNKIDAVKIYPEKVVPDVVQVAIIFRPQLEAWLQMYRRDNAPEPIETFPLPSSQYDRIIVHVAANATNAAFNHAFSAILEIDNTEPLIEGLYYVIEPNDSVPHESDYPNQTVIARQWSEKRQIWYAREGQNQPDFRPEDVKTIIGCVTDYLVKALDRLKAPDSK